jgi:hypothetical protein
MLADRGNVASTHAQQPSADASAPAAAAEGAAVSVLLCRCSRGSKLGTSFGGLGAYIHTFDPDSRVSLFGVSYQYTSTHSQIAAAFARTSFGADHHRITVVAPFGHIKNDYDDYLGTGQPLKTDDHLRAIVARYLFRAGVTGSSVRRAALRTTRCLELRLKTTSPGNTRCAAKSAALGAVVMHDSRDSEDMPTTGWLLNLNNLAYREGLGGSSSFDAYRVDLRTFWKHGGGHVLAVRQFNWLTNDAPAAAEATVNIRGYKQGQYLSSYMSSLEVEERLAFNARWGATLFAGAAGLYGEALVPLDRSIYPTAGAGLHFVLKPKERMIVNLEYAQGVGDNRGIYMKLGYAW